MTVTVRTLTDEAERRAGWELGRLAFGGPVEPDLRALDPGLPVTRYGAFDAAGRLVGTASDRHHAQWWGGRRVPSADVGGVAVAPEHRGRGVARTLLTALLAGARERGAALSALYPTVSAPYRALGWETGGSLRTVEVPTALLARVRAPAGVEVRAGTGADRPAAEAVYARTAAAVDGLLTREGALFGSPDGDRLPEGVDGLTLAVEDGDVTGYATWERGRGYGHHADPGGATLSVHDLLALTPGAARTLVAALGSWESVTPAVRLRPLTGLDAVTAALPVERLREVSADAWMSRPVDAGVAVAARRWPAHAGGSAAFRLVDDAAPWNAGAWRLVVDAGEGRLERTDDAGPVLHVRGWTALWTGAATPARLRGAGLLSGGDATDDAALRRTLGSGAPAALLDYF